MKFVFLLIAAFLSFSCAALTGIASESLPVTGAFQTQQEEQKVSLSAQPPPARMWASLFYHSDTNRVIMFGGGRLTDIWMLDAALGRWTSLNGSGAPDLLRMGGVRAAYDSHAQRMIVYFYKGEGQPGETWSFDPLTARWQNLNPQNLPTSRRFTDLVYDSASDRTLMFGGVMSDDQSAPTNELWAYDYSSNNWKEITPGGGPAPVFFSHMVYAAASQELILWGGKSKTEEKTVWSYSLARNEWVRSDYVHGPKPDYDGAMTYDPHSGMVYLYVGNHFWAYDLVGQDWERRSMEGGPGRQYGGSMAYDESSRRLVFFGGTGNSTDTWLYDPAGDRWQVLN